MLPLVVDLDHSLVQTDMFDETLIDGLRRQPWRTLGCIKALRQGRAALKAALVDTSSLEVDRLPLNRDVLALIDDAQRQRRPVFLVSAADQRLVDCIAKRLSSLAGWQGSSQTLNLKGARKAQWLVERFGDGGFEYVGDSRSDLKVWRHAGALVTVGLGPWLRRTVNTMGRQRAVPVLHLAAPATGLARLQPWWRLFQPAQWVAEALMLMTLLFWSRIPGAQALSLVAAYWLLGASARMAAGVALAQPHRRMPNPAAMRSNPYADGSLRLRTGALLAPVLLVSGTVWLITLGGWTLGCLALVHGMLCALSVFIGAGKSLRALLLGVGRVTAAVLAALLAVSL